MEPSDELLKLGNQLCFPFYAVSRMITRMYAPLLDEIGLTYPQYLVLLVLWERDHRSVKEISEALLLNTNTVTPLLKRMENQELIRRRRSLRDERSVEICLSGKGVSLKDKARHIPSRLLGDADYPEDRLLDLKNQVDAFLDHLKGQI